MPSNEATRRVALVHQHYGLQGSLDRDVVLLAEQLVALGHDVSVYCNPAQRSVASDGVSFHDVVPHVATTSSRLGQPVHLLDFAREATRALRRDRASYDVVYVSGLSAWEQDVAGVHSVHRAEARRWAAAANGTYRAPRLRAGLSSVTRPRGAAVRTLEWLQLRPGGYGRVIARTPRVARDLEEVHGVAADAIDVVPYPVTVDPGTRRDRAAVRELGIADGTPVLLFLGHDFERKGLDEAIAALASLEAGARLVVVGGGDRARFGPVARERGVADRILFAGPTTAPERFLAAADVLVHPARQEVWGIPVVEAALLGVPAVVSSSAGAAEAMAAAGAAVVVPPGDAEALGRVLADLLAHPERRAELGRNGRRAGSAYLPRAVALATVESFHAALAARRRKPAGAPLPGVRGRPPQAAT